MPEFSVLFNSVDCFFPFRFKTFMDPQKENKIFLLNDLYFICNFFLFATLNLTKNGVAYKNKCKTNRNNVRKSRQRKRMMINEPSARANRD